MKMAHSCAIIGVAGSAQARRSSCILCCRLLHAPHAGNSSKTSPHRCTTGGARLATSSTLTSRSGRTSRRPTDFEDEALTVVSSTGNSLKARAGDLHWAQCCHWLEMVNFVFYVLLETTCWGRACGYGSCDACSSPGDPVLFACYYYYYSFLWGWSNGMLFFF